jgi:hypothetical protein
MALILSRHQPHLQKIRRTHQKSKPITSEEGNGLPLPLPENFLWHNNIAKHPPANRARILIRQINVIENKY